MCPDLSSTREFIVPSPSCYTLTLRLKVPWICHELSKLNRKERWDRARERDAVYAYKYRILLKVALIIFLALSGCSLANSHAFLPISVQHIYQRLHIVHIMPSPLHQNPHFVSYSCRSGEWAGLSRHQHSENGDTSCLAALIRQSAPCPADLRCFWTGTQGHAMK